MDDMEEKLTAILNNPQIMQQIMSLAAGMGSQEPSTAPESSSEGFPNIDLGLLQKLSSLAGQTGIDPHQQTLLHALTPYLHDDRIRRLERAMRAAKTARLATDLLGSSGLSFLTGR